MRKLRILSLVVVLSLTAVVLSGCRGGKNAPTLQWLSGFSGTGWDSFAALDRAGSDFYAVGFTDSSDGDMTELYQHGQSDALLVRMDKKGQKVYSTAFGGSDNDVFNDVAARKGAPLAAGYTNSSDGDAQVISPQGEMDALLVSFDKKGAPVWVASFGGSGNDVFQALAETSDGGSVAVGRTSSSDGHFASLETYGNYDAFIVKYDSKGTALWASCFGGSGWDEFTDVARTRDGGYIAVGFTQSSDGLLQGITDGQSRDALIVKYDSEGRMDWCHTFGGSDTDQFQAVAVLPDGFAAVGLSQSEDGDMSQSYSAGEEGVVVKFSLTGVQQWLCPLSGTGNDRCTSVAVSGKEIVVGGYTSSTDLSFDGVESKGGYEAFVYRISSEGDPIWRTEMGSTGWDQITDLTTLSGAGFAAVGYINQADGDFSSMDALGDQEAFLAKFG